MRLYLLGPALTLAGLALLSEAAGRPLKVGVEINGPPVSFVPDGGEPTGFTIELLREIERVSPLEFELVPNWWTQILRQFDAGEIDILGNVVRTEARLDAMAFSTAHARVRGVIYTRPNQPALSRTADFAGRTIGTLAGSVAYVNAQKHEGWGARIVPFNDWQDAFDATAAGETDATLLLSPTSSRLANSHQLHTELVDDIVHEYRFALHPTEHQTLATLNDALVALQADGTMDRLYAKWIGPIEPRPIRPADLKPYLWPALLAAAALALVFSWQRHMLRRVARQAKALRQATQLLNTSQELAHVGGWEVDLERHSLFWTNQTRRIHEVDTTSTPSLDEAFAFFPPSSRARIETVWKHATERGESFELEVEMNTARGRTIMVQVIGVPTMEHGRVVRMTGAMRDITKLKQAERDRLVVSKLESTGILAGGLAHDFNNLLTVIVLNIDLAQSAPTRPGDQQRWLTSAKQAATTAQQLIRELITFAQPGSNNRGPVDLPTLIRVTAEDALAGSSVTPRFDLPATLAPIAGDEEQLRQVIRHLINNARDATPAGGTISLHAEPVDRNPHAPADQAPAPHVHLIVRDEGPGICAATQARVFDPYFSTKQRGAQKGMGLGLTICHAIVQQHQGTITLDSAPQRGTAVHVWLPVARPAAAPAETAVAV